MDEGNERIKGGRQKCGKKKRKKKKTGEKSTRGSKEKQISKDQTLMIAKQKKIK